MSKYGNPFVLHNGADLMTRTGGDLEAMWEEYSRWVLGRVHTEKCLLRPDTTKLPDGAFKQPFDALEGLLGAIAAEANEVLDEHKKLLFHGSDYAIKRAKIIEETGDAVWYLVVLLAAHNITLEEVLATNVDKLVKKDGLKSERFDERAKSGL